MTSISAHLADIQAEIAAKSTPSSLCTHCRDVASYIAPCTCTADCRRPDCIFARDAAYDAGWARPVPVFDPAVRVQPRVWPSRYDNPSAPTGAVRAPVDGLAFNESTGRYTARL